MPDRINIVLTRDKGYRCEDAIIVHSIDELFHEIEKFDKKVFVCGGGQFTSGFCRIVN